MYNNKNKNIFLYISSTKYNLTKRQQDNEAPESAINTCNLDTILLCKSLVVKLRPK